MADGEVLDHAKFTAMVDGSQADWAAISKAAAPFTRELPGRILTHLKMLKGDSGGYPVDRLEHSLQTATRAFKDGRDEEYVVCALMHDIGDILGPANHAEIGAVIMKPYVSERNHWMLDKHGIFQGYYFFHHIGLDRNMRDQFAGHPHYERTAEFCALYDNPAFDPKGETLPISEFEPMVRRVFAEVKRSVYKDSSTIAGATA